MALRQCAGYLRIIKTARDNMKIEIQLWLLLTIIELLLIIAFYIRKRLDEDFPGIRSTQNIFTSLYSLLYSVYMFYKIFVFLINTIVIV